MAKQIINIGSSEQSGDGESLRSAFDKINDNFDELYLKDTSDFNGEFSSLTNKPTTLSGYGITDAATSAQGALAATAVQPQTSLSGYGITDAYTKAEVNSEISTATSSIVIQSGSTQSIDVVAADSTLLVDSVNGTLNATTLTGALPAIDGSALTDVAAVTSNTTVFTARADVNLLMGEVVYLTGISGNTPTIDKAQANSASTMPAFGIVKADVSANNPVEVITFGSCPGHDAANFGETGITFALGDTIYVSATEAGKLTNVAPAGESNLIQNIGKIERATPTTNITIKVGGAGRTNATPALDEGNIFIGDANNRATTASLQTAIDNNVTIAFSDIGSKPTTLAGYGITDAATLNNMAPTGAVDFTGATSVDFTGATITGTSFLTSYTETDPIVGAITGIVKADGAGNISAAVAGTDYLTTVAFADLTSKPTTLAGYGITDALSSGGNITLGGDLDVGGNSIVSASNGAINIAPDGSGTIDLSGQVKFAEGMIEKFATTNGATGVTALDCSTGNVHYLTAPAGDITANFTNLNLTAEYATNVTVVIDQGGTEYEITAVQIGGVAQTIVWQGNSAPTGTANGVDSFSFTILNDGGTYVVLGQMVAFGGV